MTTPDPDPTRTPGIEQGRGVSPGETPPAEGGISGISHPESSTGKAWGPMALVLIMVVVALVAIGLIAMVVALIG
ncbi:DUF6480 family protein [Streptomyces olivochromogenes]|uniref:Uncharacterized protein n=1 Tax=Streptomyces olivochromogenes TaxID=1963 RepID=A0A250VV45_STROL|nr:DUF6480 family protein [Streptomyces olivochromogenes]KUN42446.1 hypothetical protein AQJ27_36585 [Streptomyces olivochromogenes]GAX57984.1 hypothetical protein SO3561_09555 [Streptomyces olivochromogenes]